MSDKASKDEIKLLKAQLGNLEVQVADYQQIVKDLTKKIQRYEEKYGSVFTISSSHTQTE
tara:strand:+ start:341 stop:520 length:180 start_codon:yes stop_codon:yes gene_type:complete